MPLVPLTDTVLESWAEMLQVKLPWTPPGYWSITVTVSSTPGEGTGQGQAWPHILPECFPGGSLVESACNAGETDSIPGLGKPHKLRRN